MNWQHLVYFHKAAETENFTMAANELYITVSALSKAIRNMEAELGFPLFEKQGRNSVLTKYGSEFRIYVSKAINEIEEGIQAINDQLGLVKGHIRVAGNWVMMGGFLPEKFYLFSQMYPGVTYSTKFMLTGEILDSVLAGESDLGFCGNFDKKADEYSHVDRAFLYDEELVIIVPKNHFLATSNYIDFSQLEGENFITFKTVKSGGVYEAYCALCEKYHVNPRISFEAKDDHVIVALVRAGMGVALVPFSKWLPLEDVSVLHFQHEKPKRKQYVIWKKNSFLSPVARTFRDFVIDSLSKGNEAQA